MRAFRLLGIMVLAFLPTLSLARPAPVPGPASALRCMNAPNTIAGTNLKPRSIISTSRELLPRGVGDSRSTIVWCAPHTRTYIILSPFLKNPNILGVSTSRIAAMVTDAVIEVNEHLKRFGDGVLSEAPGLIYTFTGVQGDRRSELTITQRAGKQMTYTILQGVLMAMYDSMTHASFRPSSFTIWVGSEQIGIGKLA